MNKDKAIQLLERLQDPEPYEPKLTKDAYDAIQMAIDALSADGDTISRKAAIEIIEDYPHGDWNIETMSDMVNRVKQLPPAQPEPSQVAKDIARIVENGQDMRVIGQPERIKGRWIYSSYDDESGFDESWTCDKCGYSTNIEETNFCPNCGADMREVTT